MTASARPMPGAPRMVLSKRAGLLLRSERLVLRFLVAILAVCSAVSAIEIVGSSTSGAQSIQNIGTWQATPGLLNTARFFACSVALSNGDVLIAGGENTAGSPLSSVELYDPATQTFAYTGSLVYAVYDASAVTLPNGDVLISGGVTSTNGSLSVTTAEQLYDPATGEFSLTGALTQPVQGANIALLPDGSALIAGGNTSVSLITPTATTVAEVFNPTFGLAAATGSLLVAEAFGSSASLENGQVLLAGGFGGGAALNNAEVYNPSSGTWTATAPLLSAAYEGTATELYNGQVLFEGGENTQGVALDVAELYNPTLGTWNTTLGTPSTGRDNANATLLANGGVLIAGGENLGIAISGTDSAELYSPSTQTFAPTGELVTPCYDASAVSLAGGYVLLVGGSASNNIAVPNAERYFAGVPATLNGGSSPTSATFYPNVPSSVSVSAAGSPEPSFTEVGVLPQGLSFLDNGIGTATVSGTEKGDVPGTYEITIFASNGVGAILSQPLEIVITTESINGVLYVTRSGTVYPYGDAASHSTLNVNTKVISVIGIASTFDGKGYWIATSRGNVFNYGDARFYGSAARTLIPSPIVAFAPTADREGYYLVSASGNVYCYGDATYFGGESGTKLATPIAAFAVTPDGKGYWLVGRSGTVYHFGDAPLYSALFVNPISRRIVAIVPTADGLGYWLVTQRGNVANYGDAGFYGSEAHARLPHGIVAFLASSDDKGYELVTSTGALYSFGDNKVLGSPANVTHSSPIAGLAPTV